MTTLQTLRQPEAGRRRGDVAGATKGKSFGSSAVVTGTRTLMPMLAGAGTLAASFESLELTHLPPAVAASLARSARHRVALSIGAATLGVAFARASAARRFARRFVDQRSAEEPETVMYAVDRQDEALFWSSPDRVRRWPRGANDELLAFFADNVAIHDYLTNSPDVGLHAAVVANGSALVALVGPSGSGKTTTALAAAREGFTLYSDERCIRQGGLVVPFLRALSIRQGGRAALLDDPLAESAVDARLAELGAQGDVTIPATSLLGKRAGGPPRTLDGIFIIDGRDERPSLEPCTRHRALPALLRSLLSRARGLDRVALALREFGEIPCFQLRVGSPRATARLLSRTIDERIGPHSR